MSPDNSGKSDSDIRLKVNCFLPESSGGSPGNPMHHSPARTPMLTPDSLSPSSFIPRQFPPAALSGVPMDYIVHKLHQLASGYWDRPETADCTIIVPIPHPVGRARRAPDMPLFTPGVPVPSSSNQYDPAGLGRRESEPILTAVPRVTFKLHADYLSSQSTFLRGLFAGANPLDLIQCAPPTTSTSECDFTTRKAALRFNVPENRLPRLLPSPPSHPVLFLPVPDPTSFHLLVHWMYFGQFDYIEDCLDRGLVHLAGITRNVQYLGLPDQTIGKLLRRWERAWRKHHMSPSSSSYGYESESSDEGEDFVCSSADEMDVDMDFQEEPRRGRPLDTRHLSHSSK